MARILAIDWDRHEVRGLLLSSGPTGVAVTGAWAESLDRGYGSAPSAKQIGERLAAAMGGAIGGKVTTLIGVGRDNVQMQLLSLPPAPADELPEMVRFQAEREFTTLGSDAALDFIPIAGDAQTPNQVLAVALTAEGVAEAREICSAVDVEPQRIALRAFAAAALVERAAIVDANQVALIVNPLTDEADLTVQAGEKAILVRTVRLPDSAQADARRRALVGEIRRTMAAARQQLADRRIDQVVICGSEATFAPTSGIASEFEVPIVLFDPADHAPSDLTAQGVPAESVSRFASVLGMALNEADRRPPLVDFANVRRRAEARRFTRVHALAAVAAGVAVLWIAGYLWQQLAILTREVARLEARIAEMDAQVEMYEDAIAQAAAIERWLDTDVNWLDELEQLARRVRPQPLAAKEFPVEEDVVVTQLTLLRPPGSEAVGGRIDLQAKAKSDAAVHNLERRLRDEHHLVTPGGLQQDDTLPGYPRSLDLQVQVLPPTDEEGEVAP